MTMSGVIKHAFERARRQLEEKVEKMQGETKVRQVPPMVTKIECDQGCGFIESRGGRDIYFRGNCVQGERDTDYVQNPVYEIERLLPA